MGRKDKPILVGDIQETPIGTKLRFIRQQKGISLTVMADKLGYTKSHLSAIETGASRPSVELVRDYEKVLGSDLSALLYSDREQMVLGRRHSPLPSDMRLPSGKDASSAPYTFTSDTSTHWETWGSVPLLGNLYGRDQELLVLKKWIMDEHCKIVSIVGMGGIGKTMLAAAFARQHKDAFRSVIWHSLQGTPSLQNVLKDSLHLFPDLEDEDFPEQTDEQITVFLRYLQKYRYLLILDNFESVLQAEDPNGQYQQGHEDYGKLLERIGAVRLQSCLLLTSREKPKEVMYLDPAVAQSYRLAGLSEKEGLKLLREQGLSGTDKVLVDLVGFYAGNPLALKMVAAPIRDVFDGDAAAFLMKDEAQRQGIIVADIAQLIEQQFRRLSEQERAILYWLAIEREAVSPDDLLEDSIRHLPRGTLLQTLEALQRRSMIEKERARFSLQPVIMEYVTTRFVESIYEELIVGKPVLLASHLLIKAQAKDYVREMQTRFILAPLANRLCATFGQNGGAEKLRRILLWLQDMRRQTPEYTAGNILNLLLHIGADLRGYDFSHLMVWQAYLQGAVLRDVNFTHADLSMSVFTDAFSRIFSVAVNRDGTLLAAGTGNAEIRVWTLAHGLIPLLTCRGHTDWVRAVAFSPDGTTLVSGSDDYTARLWDTDTGQCLRTFYEPGQKSRIYTVAFHPSGDTVATGDQDGVVRLWNVSTGQCFQKLTGHKDRVWSIAFSPDRCLLASGSEDQTVRLWEIETGTCLYPLREHTQRVWSVAFSPDGRLLASGSEDQTIIVWDVSTGTRVRKFNQHASWVRSIAFSPDGKILVSGNQDCTLRLWDVASGQGRRSLVGHTNWVRSVSFIPGGKTIVSGGEDQTIRVWDTQSGKCLKTVQGYIHMAYAVAFSPDRKAIISSTEGHSLRLWSRESRQSIRTFDGHTNWVRSVAFSPDGEIVASGSEDQTVRLWDAHSGQCLQILKGHTHWVYGVAFSPTGKIVISGSEDQTVRLWDVHSGQCLRVLTGHSDWVRSVAFSPDGEIVASGSEDQTVRLWDAHSGQCLQTLQGHTKRIYAVAFSPDGKTVASGSEDQTVRLWDISTGECLRVFVGHHGSIWSVAFSSAGQTIVSGHEDSRIYIWDIASDQAHTVIHGHSSRVYSVAMNSEENIIASGSHDGTIKLWEMGTGKLVYSLKSDGPYERMNITGVKGVLAVQNGILKTLGAVEKYEEA